MKSFKNFLSKNDKFSIRKLAVGTMSVVLGSVLYLNVHDEAKAAEADSNHLNTSSETKIQEQSQPQDSTNSNETTNNQEQSQPQDTTNSNETTNNQEQSQPQDSTNSNETTNNQEQSQPQDSTNSKETTNNQEQSQPQDSTNSKETTNNQEQSQPQDSTNSKETTNNQEQSQSQDSTNSKETTNDQTNSNNKADVDADAQKSSKDVDADAQKSSKDVDADAQKSSKDVDADAQKSSKDVDADAQKSSKDVDADAQKSSKDVDADAQKSSNKDVDADAQKSSNKDVDADAQKSSNKVNKQNNGLSKMINQSKNDKNYKFNKDETLKQLNTSGIDKKVGNYIKNNWDDLSQKEILNILLNAYNNEEGKFETLATNNKKDLNRKSTHSSINLMANKATTKTKNYTVKNGDYLGGIAEKFHTTISNLQKLNKSITNPDNIYVGQVIKVPSSSSSTKPSTGKNDKPSKGDTSSSKQLVTKSQLAKFGWNKNGLKDSVVKDLNNALNKFKINTPKRIQHFMAQVAQESMKGLYPTEIASGDAYEGRTDLGNTHPGDGRKFKGGGYIQLTGRSNYTAFAKAMGDNKIVEKGVEYVANKYPWSSAAWFWSTKNLNSIVDKGGTVTDVTRVVNGGTNGLNDRIAYYNQAKKIFK
ncbi:bone sialoprotein-binding protein [Staphylococcus caprae]|uniref:LysM peptidoglycan-binding domain-containing protein n=3 Tax=Staphylococcus TaxID=1279 RepID=UPI000E035473|nr:LysM peptidoglycan-binding domain-containing protein [Staphylococcus caprae]SUL94604.1 bone sialoprotein-binding protein [Staphylococcus caprae]